MEHISKINPLAEGRKPPSLTERKEIRWQKEREKREKEQQLINEFYYLGEPYPKKILLSRKDK
ncbi:MAG: hypothetical protein ACOC04_04225 [Halothece sp.]